jgi:hypothetical protein
MDLIVQLLATGVDVAAEEDDAMAVVSALV